MLGFFSKRILRIAAVPLALAAVAGGIFAFRTLRPLAVETARVESNVSVRVFGLGTVEARILSRLGFQVAGTVAELRADHGDRVSAGEVLARLDAREQTARVAKAEAAVAQAEANLSRAHASVEKARAQLEQRRQVSQRRQELLRKGNVSKEAAEDAQTAEAVARADLALAQSEVEVAKAAAADARAQLQFETAQLGRHTLTSPFDAVVVARLKELGTALGANEPLFTLVDDKTIWALAYIDEALAGGIRVGQPAEVRLRSLPGEPRAGRVVRIDIESDRVNEERRVYIACEKCPESFHLGEQAEIVITTGTIGRALLVPETAVEGFDGAAGRVWTVEDGRLHRRRVAFGRRTLDGRLEIVEGLPPAAQVLVAPPADAKEGRRARPAGPREP
jgi:HlyD family secretion protein